MLDVLSFWAGEESRPFCHMAHETQVLLVVPAFVGDDAGTRFEHSRTLRHKHPRSAGCSVRMHGSQRTYFAVEVPALGALGEEGFGRQLDNVVLMDYT